MRIRQCFLEFGGEFVDSHQETSNFEYHQNEAFYAGFKRLIALDWRFFFEFTNKLPTSVSASARGGANRCDRNNLPDPERHGKWFGRLVPGEFADRAQTTSARGLSILHAHNKM
ncbi:MAG: hypothetical protein EPN73_17100 [Paraburkholderia sp.]|nr:MAG: hypothetical protein EPN73_17100 [Paraburkholderia sp.]